MLPTQLTGKRIYRRIFRCGWALFDYCWETFAPTVWCTVFMSIRGVLVMVILRYACVCELIGRLHCKNEQPIVLNGRDRPLK